MTALDGAETFLGPGKSPAIPETIRWGVFVAALSGASAGFRGSFWLGP